MSAAETVVMITSSYPRFPGDTIGTFVEPIAHAVAARGHTVHLVLPWHPEWRRPARDGTVQFHLYRYAPLRALNVFGYAGALRADVRLRGGAYVAAPLAFASGWRLTRRIARETNATVVHAHWVLPSGAIAAAAAGRKPLVISLHGSDIYVAERHRLAGAAAKWALRRAGWITACSDDLRTRAIRLGARGDSIDTVPYGVDASRFRPDRSAREAIRRKLSIDDSTPLVFAAGRLVRKKGFEYLLDAMAIVRTHRPEVRLVLAGGGDLQAELKARSRALGLSECVQFCGVLAQDEVARYLAASDVAVVPSVRDDAGNVDGLPNTIMESLASGTPLVATGAGGIGAVVEHERTGLLVPERDSAALAEAIERVLGSPPLRAALGAAAREHALLRSGWDGVAEQLELAYRRARERRT